MTPELKLILADIVLFGFAYFWAYPKIVAPTGIKIMWRDGVVTVIAFMVGAWMFAGTQTAFNIIVIDTNWFIFQVIMICVIETPLFLWFAIRNRLEF